MVLKEIKETQDQRDLMVLKDQMVVLELQVL